MKEENKKPETKSDFRMRVGLVTGASYRSIPVVIGTEALRAAYLPIVARRADVWVVVDPRLISRLVDFKEGALLTDLDPSEVAQCLRRIWWGG
jgi:hypothetical protein|tara:strand:- start:3400 stop:3678 length:279 start_codon:yes stop_codon:yes gene_type:complete